MKFYFFPPHCRDTMIASRMGLFIYSVGIKRNDCVSNKKIRAARMGGADCVH